MTTLKHIRLVQLLIRIFTLRLEQRGQDHDQDKLSCPALSGDNLRGLTYGSQEYKDALIALQEPLKAHYAANRHHPQHFPDGIRGMNLVDLVEMFLDWYAACRRHADGDIRKSIEINEDRFNIPPALSDIFRNTVQFLEEHNV